MGERAESGQEGRPDRGLGTSRSGSAARPHRGLSESFSRCRSGIQRRAGFEGGTAARRRAAGRTISSGPAYRRHHHHARESSTGQDSRTHPAGVDPARGDRSQEVAQRRSGLLRSRGKIQSGLFYQRETPAAINPQLMKKDMLRSYWDLLNPKLSGKIVMRDPLTAGPGLATATFWYAEGALGKEFMQKLFTQQKVIFSGDDRQMLEWVARGEYLVAAAPS